MTKEFLAFQAVWYIWSNGPDLKWTALCATYDFRDLRSLLQALPSELRDDLFQIRSTLNLIPRKWSSIGNFESTNSAWIGFLCSLGFTFPTPPTGTECLAFPFSFPFWLAVCDTCGTIGKSLDPSLDQSDFIGETVRVSNWPNEDN